MKIAVAAAAGNIGNRVARKITEAGADAVLLGRDASELAALELERAKIVAADLSDANAVAEATGEAEALFWLVPPVLRHSSLSEWYEKVTSAGVEAVRANRIKKVVAVSSVGAGFKNNSGTVTYVGRMEQAFRELNADFIALRPGYFMENFLAQVAAIKNADSFAFPFAPDHDIPFVSTDDIGDVAAAYLLDGEWAGRWSRDLLGPENVTPRQAAELLSQVFERQISYRRISSDELRQDLERGGATLAVQREMVELFEALGDPNGIYAAARTFEAFTPTTLRAFIENKLKPRLKCKSRA